MNTTIHIIKQLKSNLFDIKSSTFIDFGIENNNKDAKFEVKHHVKI